MIRSVTLLILLVTHISCNVHKAYDDMEHKTAIAIQGGAGDLRSLNLTPEQQKAYMEVMSAALDAGYSILKKGGSSVDAVEATVKVMEDSPLFNAGKGSVFT